MSEVLTYNDDEVRELFDVVFKLSAKDINDKLIKVSNRVEIARRRWFWELLQNAKDAVSPDEKVSVKLHIGSDNGQPFAEFFHSGNPFQYQDAKNLIFPYSDKDEEKNSDKSGRFGTGFLATHILSKKIKVTGIYIKDEKAFDFSFTLDRSGKEKSEIADSINRTWDEFRSPHEEKINYTHNKNIFETSFRYDLDEASLQLALQSILDIETSLPFALAFIPKIQTVEIANSLDGTTIFYQKKESDSKDLTENIKLCAIEKIIIKEGQTAPSKINLVICSDESVDIAIEIFEQDGKTFIKEFLEHQPLLFCPFPLIGANDFKFPTAINSVSFLPKEERDGIWLKDEGYGPANQKLFEKIIPLYSGLCTYASAQKWQQSYLLLKSLKENLVVDDLNAKWFKEKIQTPIKLLAKQIPLVDIDNGQRISISANSHIVYFQNEVKEENRTLLWDFVKALFPDSVPLKAQVHNWYDVIWDDCPKFTINSFTKHIAGLKTITNLQTALGKTKEETLKWLDEFVSFIAKVEPALLNGVESSILPNQVGNFKRKDELYLDDGTIDDDLKEILATTSKFKKGLYDWRIDLLDKKIYLDLPANKTRTIKDIGTLTAESIRDLLKEDNPSNDLRELFSKVLNWLNDHQDKAREFFKGLKTDTLLYKTTSDSKIKYITEMIEKDRKGEISFEIQSEILNNPAKVALLSDPDLELKVRLGEQVLADFKREKEEFEFKKKTGDIFETLFHQLINSDNRFTIAKVEGEEDFIISNIATGKQFYIELKSIRTGQQQIQMTHKQAKQANAFPNNYFLCIIPNNGSAIDENYFITNAMFDGTIGTKLSSKVKAAIAFETPETGLSVEFEDTLLKSYNKYRYKFTIEHNLWGQDNFEAFKQRLLV